MKGEEREAKGATSKKERKAMKKKILLIDDDVSFVESMKRLLIDNEYDVVFEYAGQEGYHRAVSEKPDLIILDILMPKPDGYEVYKMLKESEETVNIPVIMLTGLHTLKHLWEDLYDDVYLCKPVECDDLLLKIKEVLEK